MAMSPEALGEGLREQWYPLASDPGLRAAGV